MDTTDFILLYVNIALATLYTHQSRAEVGKWPFLRFLSELQLC